MLKKITYLIILFSCISFSQTIIVDDTSYTATDLASLLLDGSCIDPTNVSYSSGQSVAHFDGNGSSFPLSEGIIIRTGIAKQTEGLYTNTNLSSQINTTNDPFLQNISNETGQTDPITDTAFLQFDFEPISSDFSFNFIFASNEYGQWQCGFSDVFAFLLIDSSDNPVNLAIINDDDPISVSTIRDNAYNGGCTSENEELFDIYNVNTPASSALNMRGHTTVLNASSTLIPGETYTIRLVIGDYKNPNFDSAVFIDTGSFTTEIDLGQDTTICTGDEINITTELDESDFSHSWTLNGNIIPGEISNSLTITEAGTYAVTAIKNDTACEIPGTITVTDLSITSPEDLSACDNGATTYTYDLNLNNEITLGIDLDIYDIIYYASQADIISGTPITSNITNYPTSGNDITIYIKIFNTQTGMFCDVELSFLLTVSPTAVATPPNDITICESPNSTIIDLTIQDTEILGGLNATDFVITYYASQADLDNQNPIPGSSITIPSGSASTQIWVLMTSSTNANCFDATTFNITINPLPVVSTIPDVIECSEYTLPNITDGNYYDGPNGTGNLLNIGDILTENGTYYIYNGPDANGCYNQSSFILTLIDEYGVPLYHCDTFSVPVLPPGDFYTETNGPNGTGTIIDPTTIFTSADIPLTVHYYAETTDSATGVTSVCRNEAFDITIYNNPLVDTLTDVVTCINYTLEPLTNGTYFNSPGGVDPILAADIILTASQTVYIYNEETHNSGNPDEITCNDESSFLVNIINNPGNRTECGSYTLPALEVGAYYYSPNGQNPIPAPELTITNFTTVYIYAATTTPGDCTANMSFDVTINPIPVVDTLSNVVRCIDDPYELPPLLNPGGYYVDDQTQTPPISTTQYNVGDIISASTPNIYIYMIDPITNCYNQSSFEVEILDLPNVDNFTDVYECDQYTLPALTNGTYFNASGGVNDSSLPNYQAGSTVGQPITEGTISNQSIPIYIYNERADLTSCAIETTFTVYILGINLGTFDNVTACDSYTLPSLTAGAYYSTSGGNTADLITPANYTYTYDPDPMATNTYTIFVYAENGIRDPDDCTAEESFTITISQTPTLVQSDFPDITECESYTLPVLDNTNFTQNYYSQPGGNPADIIDISRTIPTGAATPYTETIYVYANATNNSSCIDELSFTLTLYPLLELTISDAVICVDPIDGIASLDDYVTLDSGLNPSQYTVNWYNENNMLIFTGPSYTTGLAGVYTLETIMLSPETPPNCNYASFTVTVTESSTAIATYEITPDFEDNSIVTVIITNGFGTYQYQLNDGPFQDDNQFYNVPSGDHIITIIDPNSNCDPFPLDVTVIKYPKFFTPNGDGINDTWNIKDLSEQPNTKINIFDRYGKFIIQITPSGNGWDGTYNGSDMFSNDYWFVIFYTGRETEGYPDKEFKAHFSLKR